MSQKKTILFVYPSKSSFIRNDIKVLNDRFNVVESNVKIDNKLLVPYYLVKQFFTIIYHYRSLDSIVTSFGGYQSLLPSLFTKMFGKKSYIIVHGSDCASIPNFNYGDFRNKILKNVLRYSYKNTTKILPVSGSLIFNINNYEQSVGKQGILAFVKELKTPYKVIFNGLDIEKWSRRSNSSKKQNSFLTVVSSVDQYQLKGIDLVTKIAKIFPNYSFTIVGIEPTSILEILPGNVKLIAYVPPDTLLTLYSNNEFYLQLSISEGFGMSLCEAMLCEMIPIGSNVNMIPEIIGDSGFIVQKRDLTVLEDTINSATSVKNKNQLAKRARKRIMDNYSLQSRAEQLYHLLIND